METYLETARAAEEEYRNSMEEIKKIEGAVLCSGADLEKLHVEMEATVSHYDLYFSALNEKKTAAHLSTKAFTDFKRYLNQHTHTGGRNKLMNLKHFAKGLHKEDKEKVAIPPVMRLEDYRILLNKLYSQTDFQCRKRYCLSGILELKSNLEALMGETKVSEKYNWKSIHELHHRITESLRTYPNWKSAVKEQFMEVRTADGKKKLPAKLLQEVGLLNVASRSDSSEGYYMRSQSVHKMHIGTQNPFAERMAPFLAPEAHIYNVGGAETKVGETLVLSEGRTGRRKVNSKKINGLRDDILEHKNSYVRYIVEQAGTYTHLRIPPKQVDAKYPCVMILFSDDLMTKVNESQENIPEFLTHLLAGHINAALARAGLRPLVDRRQSFGFMTPTITDVHSGVRLSLGVIPSEAWCDAVIQGIRSADANIGSFTGYKSVSGLLDQSVEEVDQTKADPAEIQQENVVTMNKFNRGSVLGAGHKLITKTLLSEEAKNSISPIELNTIFGTREGTEIVQEIQTTEKPGFKEQAVDENSRALYNRLKSFYEQFIRISGGQEQPKEVDWTKADPAEILQELLDQSVEAVYNNSENVVGLDESSDDEEAAEPNRVPSGMSALALPIASYSSIHEDRTVIYETAPYSYFEIDTSWKNTFDIDQIERPGARYPLAKKAFANMSTACFDQRAAQYIQEQTDPLYQEMREIKSQGENKEEEYREEFRDFCKGETDKQKQAAEASETERKIEEANARTKQEWTDKQQEVEELEKTLTDSVTAARKKLEENFKTILSLMNEYMEYKEATLRHPDEQTTKNLQTAVKNIEDLFSALDKNNPEPGPERFVYEATRDAFQKYGFAEMDKAAQVKVASDAEVAFVDVNPCMTGEAQFDSGENLYGQTLKKYDKLRMIVVDVTSATQKQIKDLISRFQDQTEDRAGKEIVPFLCLAKSGTKHDQMGLDISTMGSCHYVMHNSFSQSKDMQTEFRNLKKASRSLAKGTEPPLVKTLRRNLRSAAKISEAAK